jgi:hypothetical protein
MGWLAEIRPEDYHQSLWNLIFIGLFVVACIIGLIWWLKRQA